MKTHQVDATQVGEYTLTLASSSCGGTATKRLNVRISFPSEMFFYEVFVGSICVCGSNTLADAIYAYNDQ